MQTTGLDTEPIGRLYEGEQLGAALRDARARTLGCYAHLDLAALEVPCIPIVNLPLWELAHIAWFQEYWCLRYARAEGGPVRASMEPRADALFDSARVPHRSRWQLDYPPQGALRAYIDDTHEATLGALAAGRGERYFFELALLHEDMHGEALLMTLQTLALPAPDIAGLAPPAPAEGAARDVALEGGEFEMGTRPDAARFVFDNEKWAHAVRVDPFAIADAPTTQGEFAAFVDDGGYGRRDLWTDAGWAWRQREGRIAPRHWRREGGRWMQRRFDRWLPLDPAAPMIHLAQHEALAYCRWAKRRLPTEAEWEFAALEGAIAKSPGAAWEWTSTPFAPYPGFAADPYKEYSEPWFHSHFVLRGGSFATRRRLVHERFRNFYLPERDDAFAGMRTCAVESP